MFKKNKIIFYLAISISLGFLVARLFLLLQNDVEYITLARIYNQKKQLAELKSQVEISENKYKKAQLELERYLKDNDWTVIKDLRDDIENTKKISGLSSVKGQGVIIIINDSSINDENRESSSLIVHDFDIQNIITDLRNAGAEAISVNGQRVVAGKSKIKCAGPTIQINETVVAQPFIIKAIGERYDLEAAVNSPNGYANVLKSWDIFIEVNTTINTEVEKYDGVLEFKYLKDYTGDIK